MHSNVIELDVTPDDTVLLNADNGKLLAIDVNSDGFHAIIQQSVKLRIYETRDASGGVNVHIVAIRRR